MLLLPVELLLPVASMATHRGREAGEEEGEGGEGKERRAHAWACYSLHERVKDTG